MLVREPGPRAGVLRAAVVARILELHLVALQRLAGGTIGIRILLLAAFADPAGEFIGIEMGITAICNGREGAILEGEEGGIGTLGAPRCIPGAGLCAHAL